MEKRASKDISHHELIGQRGKVADCINWDEVYKRENGERLNPREQLIKDLLEMSR